MKSKHQIEYFRDANRFAVSFEGGWKGFFYWGINYTDWEFVVPGSIRWDSLIQDCHRQNHDFYPCKKEDLEHLPQIPNPPLHKHIKWSDNFKIKKPIKSTEFPLLSKFIDKQSNKSTKLYFLLAEDLYESYFGDGIFLYPTDRVFIKEKDAIAEMTTLNKYNEALQESHRIGERHSLKKFDIKLKDGELIIENYEAGTFEHYYIEEILKKFENKIKDLENGKIKPEEIKFKCMNCGNIQDFEYARCTNCGQEIPADSAIISP